MYKQFTTLELFDKYVTAVHERDTALHMRRDNREGIAVYKDEWAKEWQRQDELMTRLRREIAERLRTLEQRQEATRNNSPYSRWDCVEERGVNWQQFQAVTHEQDSENAR